MLFQKIRNKEWLNGTPDTVEDHSVEPYLVADSAFSLSCTTMKCYDVIHLSHWKRSFNHNLIHTHHVVEQAFGRLKGRWKVIDGCYLNDLILASRVALVCCALHNVCERHQCPFEDSWLPDPSAYTSGTTAQQSTVVIGSASSLRDILARYIHHTRPAPN